MSETLIACDDCGRGIDGEQYCGDCVAEYCSRIAELEAELERLRGPVRLAIYTTDDGCITSVVEQGEDGDPVDREIDASAIVAHTDMAVERYEGLLGQWSRACEIAMKHCGRFAPEGRSVFEYIPAALATAREAAVREFAEWLRERGYYAVEGTQPVDEFIDEGREPR